MKKTIDEIWPLVAARLRVSVLLMILITVGLVMITPGDTLAAGGTRYLWQSRDQFVAIQPQDNNDAVVLANNHPATFSPDQLRGMLKSLQFIAADQDKPLPVFNEPEREILVELLREGLSTAEPREDVTFAIIGQFPTLFGLAKERKVTTGRLFFEGGKLNIIFGMVHHEVNDKEDRRLAPFTPGSRSRTAKLEGKLQSPADNGAITLKRANWIALAPESVTAVPSDQTISPRLMDEPEHQIPATRSQDRTNKQTAPNGLGKNAGERLKILNALKNEKLITDDEYRAKRQEILNEL